MPAGYLCDTTLEISLLPGGAGDKLVKIHFRSFELSVTTFIFGSMATMLIFQEISL